MTVNELKQEIDEFLKTHSGKESIMLTILDDHITAVFPVTSCYNIENCLQISYRTI